MDLPEAQGSLRHARESKSGIPEIFLLLESGILEILIEEFGILGFEIRNPRHGIQNLGPSWIPLHGDATRLEFIDDSIYLGLAAPLAMKMPLRKILIRPEGCLVYHSESTKIQLYNA